MTKATTYVGKPRVSNAIKTEYLGATNKKGHRIQATTHQVCPEINTSNTENPRWKEDKPMWDAITLECEGQAKGVTAFDQFQIQLKKRSTHKNKIN